MNDIVFAGTWSPRMSLPESDRGWFLLYVTGGALTLRISGESHSLHRNELAVLPPEEYRTVETISGERSASALMLIVNEPSLRRQGVDVIADNHLHLMQNAMSGAVYHYTTDAPERHALLAAYGQLLVCYIAAWQTINHPSDVVEIIRANIQANYADAAYALDDYLRTLPFSYDYLRKLFQRDLGITPHQYLNRMRLQAAAAMLRSYGAACVIADVARLSGFREPLYFSRVFKKYFGVAPSFYATAETVPTPLPDA